MNEDRTIQWVNARVDHLLGIETDTPQPGDESYPSPGAQAALAAAARLAETDLADEIRLPARGAAPRRAPAFPRRWAWAALAVVALLAALLAFRQPVLAAA
ncbi:MAG: hypothetical protein GYA17_03595, partial [Chloroflexi bacterium]|nr:hypothetical protein [Chloroflexota bacterium]